jgi:hypothetical protein
MMARKLRAKEKDKRRAARFLKAAKEESGPGESSISTPEEVRMGVRLNKMREG